MRTELFRRLIELNAHPFIANALRRFAQSSLSKGLVAPFANTYNIDVTEAGRPLADYETLHAFFTRHLKPGSRPIDAAANTLVSPCDGVLSVVTDLTEQSRFEVKGQTYTVAELLGSQQEARRYAGGTLCVLYLSPRDYHRVHVPVAGRVVSHYELGDRSAPVNDWGLRHTLRPLTRNYRRVTRFETVFGNYDHIMVGAVNVNTIAWTAEQAVIEKGGEVGYFSFGSTVVLCFEKGHVHVDQGKIGPVRLGEVIGTLSSSAADA